MRNAKDTDIPVAYLGECFSYDADSGALTWKRRPSEHFSSAMRSRQWNTRHAGKRADVLSGDKGHRRVILTVGGHPRQLKAHRIIFALTHGHWPEHEVDHGESERGR